jgi:hypothetical protein
MACDVARHEPYRACMDFIGRKINKRNPKCQIRDLCGLALSSMNIGLVSQRMIVEMGDYAWSEHIVTVFLACQITIKNVQVQLTVKGKTIPDSYTRCRQT